MQESWVATVAKSFKPVKLRCVKVWFHAFSVKSTQGIPRRPKGIAVYIIFPVPPSPSLVMTQVKESRKITFLSLSPYSQHFIFSLLPTFSGHFSLLPIMYLPPLNSVFVLSGSYYSSNTVKKPLILEKIPINKEIKDISIVNKFNISNFHKTVIPRGLQGPYETTTATATGTSKDNRFNEQNNNSAHASLFFVHFFLIPA